MSDAREKADPAQSVSETGRLTCFVIGPIGNRHGKPGSPERLSYEEAIEVLEEVILPACALVGLEPVRADGLARAGEITDQVFRRLRDDDVVIADVTGANANVMYELGLRHTRNKLTVQVGEYGRLPFDLNVIRTVMFSRSPHGLVAARNELSQILEAGLLGEYDPVTATRVWNEAALAEQLEVPVAKRSDADADPTGTDEPGFIDLVAGAEDGHERITAAATELTDGMGRLAALAEASTAEMAASDAQGRGMKGRLAILVQFAAGVSKVAEDIEATSAEYVAAMEAVSAGTLALIERLEGDPSLVDEGMGWAMMTRRLSETSREMLGELSGFVESMKENAKLSRVLREPTNRVVNAFDRIASATSVADEWDRRLQGLGIPLPPPDWEPDEDETEADEGSASTARPNEATDAAHPSD